MGGVLRATVALSLCADCGGLVALDSGADDAGMTDVGRPRPLDAGVAETVPPDRGPTPDARDASREPVLCDVAMPVFHFHSGPGGCQASFFVSISTATPAATIWYALDGDIPNRQAWIRYDGNPVLLTWPLSGQVSAQAVQPGCKDSPVNSAPYVVPVRECSRATAPSFSPAGGTYTQPQTVQLSASAPGFTIYYTLDGTTPDTGSPKYSSPLIITITTKVKAMATSDWTLPSDVSSAVFTIVSPPIVPTAIPTISPGSGTYTAPQTIVISGEAGADILYTTDSSVPSDTGGGGTKVYSTPFELARTGTVVAIAKAPGKSWSHPASASIAITP